MKQFPPSPPRTILVVDDRPSDVSFICSVLDAHALPYMVQVIDPSDPAFDSFDHLTQNESRRVPTLILHRTRPQQAGPVLWRRLIALWPAVTLPRVLRRLPQGHTAAYPSTPLRLRWPRGLAWGVGLGLLVGLVSATPLLWQAGQPPRVPISPPPRSDHMAAALLGAPVLAAPPANAAHPPAQSQTPAVRAHITGAELGVSPTGGSRQPPRVSEARNAAYLRPHAADQPRAARAARVRHTRKRYAPLRPATPRDLITARGGAETSTRPRDVEHARVMGAPRSGEWPAALSAPQQPWWQVTPDPAPEVARPWNQRIVNDSGV
jgi:hypothetical protein